MEHREPEIDSGPRLDAPSLDALRILFAQAQADRPAHVGTLARELGLSKTATADLLVRLDRAGLVRAERARLTMRGLSLAARLPRRALRVPSLVPAPADAAASPARPLGQTG